MWMISHGARNLVFIVSALTVAACFYAANSSFWPTLGEMARIRKESAKNFVN
jgi:hypothetical protein